MVCIVDVSELAGAVFKARRDLLAHQWDVHAKLCLVGERARARRTRAVVGADSSYLELEVRNHRQWSARAVDAQANQAAKNLVPKLR